MNSYVDYIELYEQGLSTYQIADKLKVKPNTARWILKHYGVIKKSLGLEIEEKVAKWFENKGMKVQRQKGDNPFDLIINKEKIDVKSAHMGKNLRYMFQLQDKSSRKEDKDLSKIDWFYLIFLEDMQIYKVKPNDLNCKYTLNIGSSLKSKYPIQFIGYLD